ncbi:MAG: L-threonylcarbamoyladenylate synthase [Oscillospiraceae bacterium]|nr:L-threonylcarbamoyladenylate synthase [Oscillospiraceae bacterium]
MGAMETNVMFFGLFFIVYGIPISLIVLLIVWLVKSNKSNLYSKTQILYSSNFDIKNAAKILRNSGTVAFPTETVYGLGANALDEAAVAKIFAAKGRPSDNPLIVHIAERDDVYKVAREVSEAAKLLMDQFWGGPLTLILKRQACVPDIVTAGLDTVAVRMPANEIALELIRAAGVPIAAPSANVSGKPSPTAFEHVKHDLFGKVDVIIDGGSCDVGLESTVIDMTREVPIILRPGGVSREEIEAVIGQVDVVTKIESNDKPASPGMKYKHYAPNAKIIICDILENAENIRNQGGKVGVLIFDEYLDEFVGVKYVLSLGSVNDAESAARNLFGKLRKFDTLEVDLIYAPKIPENGMWAAVRNRLYKAAGEN